MNPKTETNTTSLAVIGVDIGKDVFTSLACAPMERSFSEGRSGAWVSEMSSRS